MQPVARDVACSMVYGCMRAPGVMRPWFDFWFWRYMHCLLVYIVCSPTYPFFLFFLTYLLPYLSFPLRTDPLYFQARCRKRQLNLALVFCVVVHFFWSVNACFCCVRFSFFSIPGQEIGLVKHARNYLFCVEWDVKPRHSQSVWLLFWLSADRGIHETSENSWTELWRDDDDYYCYLLKP